MDLFSGIGKSLEGLAKQAKDVGKKVNIGAKEASKNTRLKLKIKEMEVKIQEAYGQLGQTYYMEMRSQSHRTEMTSAELLCHLDDLQMEKDALNNLIKYRELEETDQVEGLTCVNCHQELSPGDRFCSYCGHEVLEKEKEIIEAKQVREVECPNCYFMVEEGTSFCSRCGSKI